MNSVKDPEKPVAQELALVLSDDAFWARVQTPANESAWRERMGSRALLLYDLTSPIVAENTADRSRPVDYAAGLLRDVGDACAILTQSQIPEHASAVLPERGEFESIIIEFGLEDWASSLGVELSVDDPDEPTWGESTQAEDDLSTRLDDELARDWSRMISIFRTTIDLRAQDPDLESPSWRDARDAACDLIALGRGWLAWARERDDVELLGVTGSQLLAAQGVFVSACDQQVERVFPDDEFLRRFLRRTGALQWLDRHGAEIPDWLLT